MSHSDYKRPVQTSNTMAQRRPGGEGGFAQLMVRSPWFTIFHQQKEKNLKYELTKASFYTACSRWKCCAIIPLGHSVGNVLTQNWGGGGGALGSVFEKGWKGRPTATLDTNTYHTRHTSFASGTSAYTNTLVHAFAILTVLQYTWLFICLWKSWYWFDANDIASSFLLLNINMKIIFTVCEPYTMVLTKITLAFRLIGELKGCKKNL